MKLTESEWYSENTGVRTQYFANNFHEISLTCERFKHEKVVRSSRKISLETTDEFETFNLIGTSCEVLMD